MYISFTEFLLWASEHHHLVNTLIEAAAALKKSTTWSERAEILSKVATELGGAVDALMKPLDDAPQPREFHLPESFMETNIGLEELEAAHQLLLRLAD